MTLADPVGTGPASSPRTIGPVGTDPTSSPVPGAAPAAAFALEGVCAGYDPAVPVLAGASAVFAPGRVHVIEGPSGAGKTTLMNLLMGLMEPASGTVIRSKEARLSAVFQEDRLLDGMTATANARLPRGRLRGSELEAFLARAREGLLVMGLDASALDRPVRELSGGQRRRVAILRALLANADAFFFDEPLRGLDAQTARAVMGYALPLLAKKTVFWVTHDPDEAGFFADPVLWRVESGEVAPLQAPEQRKNR